MRAASIARAALGRRPSFQRTIAPLSSSLKTMWLTTTSDNSLSSSDHTPRTGAGHGHVRDRVLPTFRLSRDSLFRHTPSKTCAVIGAPMTHGQPHVGTDSGPALLRQAGLDTHLKSLGWNVNDLGDLDFDGLSLASDDATPSSSSFGVTKNSLQVGMGAKLVRDVVYKALQRGEFPLTLGGDHSVGLGTLAGVLQHRPDTGIIWVDAHADLNTPLTSESGNMHGMPVGMLMKHISPPNIHTLPGMSWLEHVPRLDPSQVVYIGLRDVDPEERKMIQQYNICAYTMHEIDRYGIGHVMEMAFHHLLDRTPDRPLHVSYDIDAVDPVLAPATGTTVRGGLTFREAHYVAEAVALTSNLMSADVVEVNPMLSHSEGAKETVELGIQIITSLMGKSII